MRGVDLELGHELDGGMGAPEELLKFHASSATMLALENVGASTYLCLRSVALS
jgi:hypothetical protein